MKITGIYLKKRKNFSYITVIMFSVVFMLIFSIYTKAVDYNNSILSHKSNKTKSYYLAESGIVQAFDVLKNMNITTSTDTSFLDDGKEIAVPKSSVINMDALKLYFGIDKKFIKKSHFLSLAIFNYKSKLIDNIETKITNYRKAAMSYDTSYNQINLINKVNSINSDNIVIMVDSFYINQDFVIGSPDKSVTLIVKNISVNNNSLVKIYGNLIVLDDMYCNYMSNMNIYKVKDFDSGSLYCKDYFVFNSECNISIENLLYSEYLTLNRKVTLNTGMLVLKNHLTTNIDDTKIYVTGDIITEDVKFNQSVIISAGGDFIIGGDFKKDSSAQITVGGKIAVEDNIYFNGSQPILITGGGTSSLITEEETDNEEEDTLSNEFPITYQALNPMGYKESHSYKYTMTQNDIQQYNIVSVGLFLKTETTLNAVVTTDANGIPTIVSIIEIKQ